VFSLALACGALLYAQALYEVIDWPPYK